MQRYVVARISLFALIFISLSSFVHADDRRDGNWWQSQGRVAKLNYMTGFFDGMDLGHNFSVWKLAKDPKKLSAMSDADASYNEYADKYFKNVTSGQLVDGLDAFYSDFANRSIQTSSGVWLVLNQISGNPNITTMILNFRKNSH